MGLLFSGLNVMFSELQNGHILAKKLNFEKLTLKVGEKKVPFFVYFGLFSEIWSFYGVYPIIAAKVYFTVHFPKF